MIFTEKPLFGLDLKFRRFLRRTGRVTPKFRPNIWKTIENEPPSETKSLAVHRAILGKRLVK